MDEDVYTLKMTVGQDVLSALNSELETESPYYRFSCAIDDLDDSEDKRVGRDGYIDLLDAALSGKRVVNPKLDRDRLDEIKKNPYVSEADMKWLISEVERLRGVVTDAISLLQKALKDGDSDE